MGLITPELLSHCWWAQHTQKVAAGVHINPSPFPAGDPEQEPTVGPTLPQRGPLLPAPAAQRAEPRSSSLGGLTSAV